MKIYLVRHGETESNHKKKLMGQRFDEPLNQLGIAQAQDVAEKLSGQKFDVIFSSPQKRALQTAEFIAQKQKLPIMQSIKIMERDFGDLSGKSWDEMDEAQKLEKGTSRRIDFDQKYDYRPFGGESAKDVQARFLEFAGELKKSFFDKKVLVVAHGGILRTSQFLCNNEKLQHIENTAVMECEI